MVEALRSNHLRSRGCAGSAARSEPRGAARLEPRGAASSQASEPLNGATERKRMPCTQWEQEGGDMGDVRTLSPFVHLLPRPPTRPPGQGRSMKHSYGVMCRRFSRQED